MRRLRENVIWGLKWGITYAVVYSIIASVIIVAGGGRAHFEKYPDLTLPRILAAYFAGGLLAGAIVGVLRPFAKSSTGAALIGLVAAVPVMWGIFIALVGFPWDSSMIFAAIVGPILVGPATGVLAKRYLAD